MCVVVLEEIVVNPSWLNVLVTLVHDSGISGAPVVASAGVSGVNVHVC